MPQATVSKDIPLGKIRIDGETQARAALNAGIIDLYAEEVEKLPPGKATFDGRHYWLYEGFHRFHAHQKSGAASMLLEVITGTVEDARWLAAGSNKDHDITGLRRTNADKRRAVVMALKSRPEMSDRAIAEHVGVSAPFVGDVRQSTVNVSSQPAERTGKDGRTINTANIGNHVARAPEPAPEIIPRNPVQPPRQPGELIPELRVKLSPKFWPTVEAARLTVAQQSAMVARLVERMDARQALAEVQGLESERFRETTKTPARPEQLVFDWPAYDAAFGIIEDQVDLLARVTPGPAGAKLGALLAEVRRMVNELAGRA